MPSYSVHDLDPDKEKEIRKKPLPILPEEKKEKNKTKIYRIYRR